MKFGKGFWELHIVMFFFASCQVKPVAINYGADACEFCTMTIVDKQHAAEVVTDKGKVYKYDAIECMINHLPAFQDQSIALKLVNDFDQPGELVDAESCTYLVSENIPSPMGEYLSAFNDKNSAQNFLNNKGGMLFSWAEITARISNKNTN